MKKFSVIVRKETEYTYVVEADTLPEAQANVLKDLSDGKDLTPLASEITHIDLYLPQKEDYVYDVISPVDFSVLINLSDLAAGKDILN